MNHWILIDPTMKLKRRRKQWNRLVQDLYSGMDKPKQKEYQRRKRNTLRSVLYNLYELPSWKELGFHRHHTAPEYKSPKWFTSKYVTGAADYLAENNLIVQKRGRYMPKEQKDESLPSRMVPTLKMMRVFREYDVEGSIFEVDLPNDLIRLNGTEGDLIKQLTPGYIKYAERNLKRLNELYKHCSIQFEGREIVRRYVYRVFNMDYQKGGRFYGDDIKGMNKKERQKLILNYEPTTEYDYSCFHPTILYSAMGIAINDDIYQLPGYPDSKPDRAVMKKALIFLINTGGNHTRTIRALMNEFNVYHTSRKTGERYLKMKRPAWLNDPRKFVADVADRHKPIVDRLTENTGRKLQYVDSLIADKILNLFADREIPIIGVHDSFVVPKKDGYLLRDIMYGVFESIFNTLPKVTHEY